MDWASLRLLTKIAMGAAIALLLLLSFTGFHKSSGWTTRECQVPWKAYSEGVKPKIAMVSLSTPRAKNSQLGLSDFSTVNSLTGETKKAYAEANGYIFIDESAVLDRSRPASWSKIKAVLKHLDAYDWIFWMDADALITNYTLPLESLLPTDGSKDFILSTDAGGFNAGMWFARNSAWTRSFLERWWSMDSFIRREPGDTKSGDNDALKVFLRDMPRSEFEAHVGVAPQCSFNSYRWRPSLRNWIRFVQDPTTVNQGLWQPGDLVLHLAGFRDKLSITEDVIAATKPDHHRGTGPPKEQVAQAAGSASISAANLLQQRRTRAFPQRRFL